MKSRFDEYMDRQPVERRREILAAERAYLERDGVTRGVSRSDRPALDGLEKAFSESLKGYADPPAGMEGFDNG